MTEEEILTGEVAFVAEAIIRATCAEMSIKIIDMAVLALSNTDRYLTITPAHWDNYQHAFPFAGPCLLFSEALRPSHAVL